MRSVATIMNEIAAVILVGGKSSRMGRDKATLPYCGKRLVDVVADAIRDVGVEHIFVSGEIEGYPSLPDLLLGRGPMGGICSSAVRLHKHVARVLFIPVDMPHISPELLRLLIAESMACHFENHPLPCQLFLDKKTMHQLDSAAQTLARQQNLSVKTFLADLAAKAITVPENLHKALTNTNTPEEWQEVIS